MKKLLIIASTLTAIGGNASAINIKNDTLDEVRSMKPTLSLKSEESISVDISQQLERVKKMAKGLEPKQFPMMFTSRTGKAMCNIPVGAHTDINMLNKEATITIEHKADGSIGCVLLNPNPLGDDELRF
jgi:hypothetical protein